jgi:hypothetical protein
MESKLTFEVGKHYKTRDGKKATVYLIRPTYMVGEIEKQTGNPYTWDREGLWHASKFPYSCDLVAEWREPRRWKVAVYESVDGTCQVCCFNDIGGLAEVDWRLAAQAEIVEGEGL